MNLDRNAKISLLSWVVVGGFALGVVIHYILGVYLGKPYPYSTFLFLPTFHWSDFFDVLRDGHTLNPYLGYKSAQYPFLVIMGYLFSLIPQSYFIYSVLIIGALLFFSAVYLRMDRWTLSLTPIFTIPFLSYPFLIAMDRGNFESLLFILVLAFMFFFTRKQYLISAIVLSFAIAMKAYPAVLLILFIPERKYRDLILCAVFTGVITLFSLLLFKGGLLANLDFLLHGSNISSNVLFSQFTSINSNMVERGVALLSLFKIIYYETGWLPRFFLDHFSLAYDLLAGVALVVTTLDVIFIEKEMWKKFALLIFAMLLLPPISADYKLLYVFLPLFLFINKKDISGRDLLYLLIFGLLLIPKDYIFLQNIISDTYYGHYFHDISISVVINILVMIFMSLSILIEGIGRYATESKATLT